MIGSAARTVACAPIAADVPAASTPILEIDGLIKDYPGGGNGFQVVNAPNPGSEVDILASVAAAGDTLWSVGHFKDGGPRQSLIERHPPEER